MEYYHLLQNNYRKNDKLARNQHFLNGENIKFACFYYECYKPNYNRARFCKFAKKVDRSEVNSKEVIARKISDLLNEK